MSCSAIENKPFSVLQERSSRERYAQHLARLICFMVRAVTEPYELYPVLLTEDQLELVGYILSGTNPATHASSTELQDDIHTLTLSILTSRVADNMYLSDPFCRFVVASSLLENGGGFVDPRSLSPLLARSQYLFRAVMAQEIHAMGNDSVARYE